MWPGGQRATRTTVCHNRFPWLLPPERIASLPGLSDVVPQADDRFVSAVVLEAEHADTGGAAEEKPPGAGREPEPTGRDHPDDVGAGECQDVALDAAYAGDEAVGPGGDVLR